MNLFRGVKFPDRYFVEVNLQTGYLLKSSWLSLPLDLRRLFFQKLTCLNFLDMSLFGKGVILLRFGQNFLLEAEESAACAQNVRPEGRGTAPRQLRGSSPGTNLGTS